MKLRVLVVLLVLSAVCFGQVNGKFNKIDANGPIKIGSVMPAHYFTLDNLTTMPASWTLDYTTPTTAIQSMVPSFTPDGSNGFSVTGAIIAATFSGSGSGLTGVGASYRAGLATNLYSGNAGSIPYQSGPSSTLFLNGNSNTTPAFLTSTGTGSAAQAPTLTTSTGSGSVVLSNSPALSGTPTAPTATAGDNSTKLATTAFVQLAVTGMISSGTLTTIGDTSSSDYLTVTLSPAFSDTNYDVSCSSIGTNQYCYSGITTVTSSTVGIVITRAGSGPCIYTGISCIARHR